MLIYHRGFAVLIGDASNQLKIKAPITFSWILNGTRDADGFASQSLDVCSERQVVTLDTLGECLLCWVALN